MSTWEDACTGLCLGVDKQGFTPASFKFFNKIISCGRKGEGQGLGPPPLWSVAGDGGLRSGPEGSVDCGGRGSAPRPDPAQGERKGQDWTEQACRPPNWLQPPLPMLGDGGASSFGLRLRTGERCSRRGRSEGYRKTWGGLLRACCLSSTPTHTCLQSLPLPQHPPTPGRGCFCGGRSQG